MGKFNKLIKYIKEPWRAVVAFDRHVASIVPDKLFLKCHYRSVMGKKLNLKNPQTFNEKIQWLKLYDRNPEYTVLVDKVAVKDYVAGVIGEEYIIPTLGVYASFDEIDFDLLPEQFVLKCTHDSHSTIICKDKSTFNYAEAKNKLTKALKRNFYKVFREWAYKNVKPKIIAEKFLVNDITTLDCSNDIFGVDVVDYKFYCFNGKAKSVMVCIDRQKDEVKFAYFDRDWNLLNWELSCKNVPEHIKIPKPENIDLMFDLANKLSDGFSFVRVDLYSCNGKVFFGELTLYPAGGVDLDYTEKTDEKIGEFIELKKVENCR